MLGVAAVEGRFCGVSLKITSDDWHTLVPRVRGSETPASPGSLVDARCRVGIRGLTEWPSCAS